MASLVLKMSVSLDGYVAPVDGSTAERSRSSRVQLTSTSAPSPLRTVAALMLRTLASCPTSLNCSPRSIAASSSSLLRSPCSRPPRRRSTGRARSAGRPPAPATASQQARLAAGDVLAERRHPSPPNGRSRTQRPNQSCPCVRTGGPRPPGQSRRAGRAKDKSNRRRSPGVARDVERLMTIVKARLILYVAHTATTARSATSSREDTGRHACATNTGWVDGGSNSTVKPTAGRSAASKVDRGHGQIGVQSRRNRRRSGARRPRLRAAQRAPRKACRRWRPWRRIGGRCR